MSKPLLLDWLGSGGKTVDRPLAEQRAFVCQYCPLNIAKGWWDESKDMIAGVIRRQLEIKHEMKLTLPNEETLHMCSKKMGGCGCCVRLKVWVPKEHIRAHTTPEQLARYPKSCWISCELNGKKL